MSESDSQSTLSADDRNVAMLAHLLGILTGFIGCLIIWLIHKDKPEKDFVNEQAKEALNFQVTMTLAFIVAYISVFVLIGILLVPILFVLDIVFCIVAGVAASNGKNYRYPFALRLFK